MPRCTDDFTLDFAPAVKLFYFSKREREVLHTYSFLNMVSLTGNGHAPRSGRSNTVAGSRDCSVPAFPAPSLNLYFTGAFPARRPRKRCQPQSLLKMGL